MSRRHIEAEPLVNAEGTPLVMLDAGDLRGERRYYLTFAEAHALAAQLTAAAKAAENEAEERRAVRLAAYRAQAVTP